MKREDLEIMAPVGSYESLMAAIQGHADSVYLGIEKLNMRSRSSNNFTFDDLRTISSIAKEHNLKTYLTVNTVIYDGEMELMKRIVDAAKENGITAVIASDIAVITYARSVGVEVHISTQCNVSNYEALKFYSQYADVVVLARELNLEQVRAITERIEREHLCGPKGELVRVEMFAHGALCMAVSGKCYLSLDNMAASANRGACLQVCRRRYTVRDTDSDIELEVDGKYIMSPKDLKTIGFMDKMIAAGVKVFKIEGRARSADYVKTVCECYDKAANAVADGTFGPALVQECDDRLAEVFNRGFWGGYYLGKTMGEWNDINGNKATKKKVYLGKVTNYFKKIGVMELRLETDGVSVGERIVVLGPTSGVVEQEVVSICDDARQEVEKAEKGQLVAIPTSGRVRLNDKVYKIVDAALVTD
ncbi:MAG: U32 family peptidase [Bacteroidales bacterium]|nr:U32 family peptidase [Bacteroidales bacterium]